MFIEQYKQVPFPIKRVYYMCGMPEGAVRGGHAHMESETVLISLKGTFTVMLDDSIRRRDFLLDDPAFALYIAPKTWLELSNFSLDSIVLVLSSALYSREETIADYELYKKTILQK